MADQNFRVKRGLEVGIGGTVITATAGGNVGIATTNPRYDLDVFGDINFEGLLYKNGALFSSGVGIGSTDVNPQSGDMSGRIGIGFTDLNIVGSGITIVGYGNTVVIDFRSLRSVGVGTAAFARTNNQFTATEGQTSFVVSYVPNYIDVFLNGVRLTSSEYTASNGTSVVLVDPASAGDILDIIVFENTAAAFETSKWISENPSAPGSGNIYRLNGNVGVGTTNPTSKLQVEGDTLVSGVVTSVGGFNLGIQSGGLNITSGVVTAFNFVGAGNTFSYNTLTKTVDINIGGSQWVFTDTVNTSTSNIYRLNGNVGIGTDNPTSKLHVVGNTLTVGISTLGVTTITNGLSANQLSVSGVSTFAGITTVTGTTLFSRQLNVSGVSTLGVTNTNSLSATQLNVSGVSTFAGITTVTGTTLFSRQLNVSGVSTLTGNVSFGSSALFALDKKVILGNGSGDDLLLYSTGSKAIAQYVGTGALELWGKSVNIQGTNGTETLATFVENDSVSLFFNNIKKFETTGYGATVFGTLWTQHLNVTGVSTLTGNVTLGGELRGPSELIIDPQTVGDNTGSVRIKGDLFVDGTQTVINSTAIELADFNVGIATTVGTNSLLDGAGIGIGSTGIRKTFTWDNTNSALKSSENINVAIGKSYQIDGTLVLNATTLGPGVINSSLISVGTLNQLRVAGISTFVNGPVLINRLTETGTSSQLLQVESGGYFSGSVGIGTTNPQNTLHVIGNQRITASSYPAAIYGTGLGQIQFGYQDAFDGAELSAGTTLGAGKPLFLNATGSGAVLINSFTSTGVANQRLQVVGGAAFYGTGSNVGIGTALPSQLLQVGVGSSAFVVTGIGSVGIGTTNPTRPLHISKDAPSSTTAQILAEPATGSNAALIQLQNNSPSNFNLGLLNSSGAIAGFTGGPSLAGFIGLGGANPLIFATNNTEALRIDSSQNVGVGTTNSGARLHVLPTTTGIAGLFSGTTSSDMVRITQLGSGNALVVEDSANPDTTPFVVTGIGSVGIGLTNPVSQLQVVSGPVIIGSATSTGTASQTLQVTGGAHFSGPTGVGATLPFNIGANHGTFTISGSDTSRLYFEDTGYEATGAGVGQFIYDNGNLAWFVGSRSGSGTVGSNELFRVLEGGNVGIATSLPSQLLQVGVGSSAFVVTGIGSVGIGTTNPTAALTIGTAGTTTFGQSQIYLNGGISNRIDFNANGGGAPTFTGTGGTTRSAGTKIILYPQTSGISVDYAFGIESGHIWQSVNGADSTYGFKWYGGITQLAVLRGDGNLGIGTTNPTSLLHVQGNALITGIATVNSNFIVNGNTLVADATNNRVGVGTTVLGATLTVVPSSTSIAGLFSGSTSDDMIRITQTGTGNCIRIEDEANPDSTPFVVHSSGPVGCGTTNAGAQLHVLPTTTSIAGLFSGTTSNDMVRITQLGTGNALLVEDSTNPDVSPFVVGAAGSVGIATANPIHRFQVGTRNDFVTVVSAAGTVGVTTTRITGINTSSIVVGQEIIGVSTIVSAGTTVTSVGISSIGISPATLNTMTQIGVAFTFGTRDDSKLFVVTSEGDVGIGTTNPRGKIHIIPTSTGMAGLFSGSSSNDLVRITQDGTGNAIRIDDQAGGTTPFIVDNQGRVGINTISASTNLTVNGNSLIIGISTISSNSSSDALRITQLGSGNALVVEDSTNPDLTPFVVTATGSVGIGTTNPQVKLHTEGDIFVGVGYTVLVGYSSVRNNLSNTTQSAALQLEGIDAQRRAVIISDEASSTGPSLILAHQRSGSVGGNTILQSGDSLGAIVFQGSDGSEFVGGAAITAVLDENPAANNLSGSLVFNTNPGAAGVAERMRIVGDGHVGIATTAPNQLFHVGAATTQSFVVTGVGTVSVGTTSPTGKFAVHDDTATPSVSPVINIQRLNNITLSNVSPTNADLRIKGHSSNYKVYVENQNSTPLFAITGSGNVGVATTNPITKLQVEGDLRVSGVITSTDYNSASDIKLKTNVSVIENPLDKIVQLNGVEFTWKETGRKSLGVIAQEVEKVLPDLVCGDDPKTVNYNGLIGLLIECVKEQQKEIDNLKQRLNK